jgi:hypothetical protein
MFNTMGIFDVALPEVETTDIQTSIADIQEISQSHQSPAISGTETLLKLMPAIFSALGLALFISPLLLQYGMPLEMVAVIQSGIGFVYIGGLAQFLLNRYFKNAE